MTKISTNSKRLKTRAKEVSSTGDYETDDFDLKKAQQPERSTVLTQIKRATFLGDNAITLSSRATEFDRLKMAIYLPKYGKKIHFKVLWLEDVDEPWKKPYSDKCGNREESSNNVIDDNDGELDDSELDLNNLFNGDDFDNETDYEVKTEVENTADNVGTDDDFEDIIYDTTIKKRITNEDYNSILGLNNLYIHKGYLVIDITGKFMAKTGFLGSINKYNIKEALELLLEFKIIDFDVDEFLNNAQVFLCDMCVDITLADEAQVKRFINGISSFFPIATNRYNIRKYGWHGLELIPKAKTNRTSFVIYHKGQELRHYIRWYAKANLYTHAIGFKGKELAGRTLRLEFRACNLKAIRETLNIDKETNRVVKLTDILNSREPVMLEKFKLFSGEPEILLERLKWLDDTIYEPENYSLKDVLVSERFVEILQENRFDLELVKSHFREEYGNVNDTEIERFNQLANLRRNIINFLVYRKPRSVTIMLKLLVKIQEYYGNKNGETL